jgi:CubicO group peptidase (beta-lactamase class C family)
VAFSYDLARFSALTPAVEACSNRAYRPQLDREILGRLGMADSVPGRDLALAGSPAQQLFDSDQLARYGAVLQRLAVPYKVDKNGKPARGNYPDPGIDAAVGLVSTVRDLARFDAALDDYVLLRSDTLAALWNNQMTTAGTPMPTGLGWFVQTYNGERVVWQFGSAADSFSSLVIKVPARRLTLILLANSDGLSTSASKGLAEGDVTASPFARLFFRTFLP